MKGYLIDIWDDFDPVYQRIRRFSTITSKDNIPVFRVHVNKYRGPEQVLSDGSIITKGDYLVRIHLHNIRLLQHLSLIKSKTRRTMMLYQMVSEALPAIANYIRNHQLHDQIKAIWGVTMLNKLVGRLGFDTKPIPNLYYRLLKYSSQIPIHILSTGSFSSIFEKRKVSYLFMSKDRLLKT
ncbi:hypothetical protein ACERII_19665 [Evansella sp. AB-rgal1]|uniref:YkoP family protein n=1 Tax=Evansella sp. AB-rgal1 TaxID=3242696 RepID=UPI00359D2FD3